MPSSWSATLNSPFLIPTLHLRFTGLPVSSRASILSHNQVPGLGPQKCHDLPEIIKQDHGSSGRHLRPPTFGPGPCPLLQFLVTSYLQEARGPACVFLPFHTPSLLSPSRADLVPMFSFGENDIYDQVENSPGSWLWWFQD